MADISSASTPVVGLLFIFFFYRGHTLEHLLQYNNETMKANARQSVSCNSRQQSSL